MARPISNLRLFVAIYPPPEHAERFLETLQSLDLPPHRATPAAQIHLTLLFIGDMPANEMDWTIESVERSAAGLRAFELAPQRLITLPERGPARLVAAETSDPTALMEIHTRLATRLASAPADESSRRFRPHMTLARFNSPSNRAAIDPSRGSLAVGPFAVERIHLMRSTLRPHGAEHHPVHVVPLLPRDE